MWEKVQVRASAENLTPGSGENDPATTKRYDQNKTKSRPPHGVRQKKKPHNTTRGRGEEKKALQFSELQTKGKIQRTQPPYKNNDQVIRFVGGCYVVKAKKVEGNLCSRRGAD